MRPKQICSKCGAPVDARTAEYRRQHKYSMLCKKCHCILLKVKQQKHKQLKKLDYMQRFSLKRCMFCGSKLKWKLLYLKKSFKYLPKFCSLNCSGKYAKINDAYSKLLLLLKIMLFIKSSNKWVSYKQVLKLLSMTPKVLVKNNISILQLNKRVLGIQYSRYNTKRELNYLLLVLSLDDICVKYNIRYNTYYLAIHAVIKRRKPTENKLLMLLLLKSYIKSKNFYISYKHLSGLLKIDYSTIHDTYEIDLKVLNYDLGFRKVSVSWYLYVAFKIASKYIELNQISRLHIFTDCRSNKGYPLRFDLYIPSLSAIILIDGQQHTDKRSKYYNLDGCLRDAIKLQYAELHNLKLYRISTTPRHTFLTRMLELILGIVKPVELLETLPSKVEGNQQPSLQLEEGSETIEIHQLVNRVELS